MSKALGINDSVYTYKKFFDLKNTKKSKEYIIKATQKYF